MNDSDSGSGADAGIAAARRAGAARLTDRGFADRDFIDRFAGRAAFFLRAADFFGAAFFFDRAFAAFLLRFFAIQNLQVR